MDRCQAEGNTAEECAVFWDEGPEDMAARPKVKWLRADATGAPIGVDRNKAVLHGFVMAQEGPFKSQGRGEFNERGLKLVQKLARDEPAGLKSPFNHPTLSDDGVGKHLGRVQSVRMDSARIRRKGEWLMVKAVRGDLHFDATALRTPPSGGRPLGQYVMDLAESDPDALSSSLVLEADEEFRLNKDGTRATGEDGTELPPLWYPKALHSADIVNVGDAVDGLLSAPQLAEALSVGTITPDLAPLLRFDRVASLGAKFLDEMFKEQGQDELTDRVLAWLGRYLAYRFPDVATPKLDALRARLAAVRGRMK